MQKEREKERERQKEEKRAERRLENEIGDMIGCCMVLFALIMMWRAIKRRRLTQLILFTFLGLISTFPPFLFLPILPVYFWWYYQLFKDTHDNMILESRFGIALIISWVFFAVLFHSIFGGIAIVYAIIWAIACFFAYRLIYMHKMYASRCDHCNYYGPNTIIDKVFIREHIRQTVTRSHTLEDRVETDEQITEWYRRRSEGRPAFPLLPLLPALRLHLHLLSPSYKNPRPQKILTLPRNTELRPFHGRSFFVFGRFRPYLSMSVSPFHCNRVAMWG